MSAVLRALNGVLTRLPERPPSVLPARCASLARFPDWLVIAQEEWDEVEHRNQLLMRALAERHPRSRFLFAEQPLRPRHLRSWRVPRLAQGRRTSGPFGRSCH